MPQRHRGIAGLTRRDENSIIPPVTRRGFIIFRLNPTVIEFSRKKNCDVGSSFDLTDAINSSAFFEELSSSSCDSY